MSSYSLVLSEIAEKDIESAVTYYGAISPHLKNAFIDSLDQSLVLISQNPLLFSKRFEEVRIKLVKKFPFTFFYTVDDCFIKVHGVLHHRRNLEILSNRL